MTKRSSAHQDPRLLVRRLQFRPRDIGVLVTLGPTGRDGPGAEFELPLRVGDDKPSHLLTALGADSGATTSRTWVRFLAALVLHDPGVPATLEYITAEAFPGRSPRSVGVELARLLRRSSGGLDGWPVQDAALVQFFMRRRGADPDLRDPIIGPGVGPYRINPGLPVDADRAGAREMLGAPIGGVDGWSDLRHLSPEAVLARGRDLSRAGHEARAASLYAATLAPRGGLELRDRAEVTLRLCEVMMQLGHSVSATRYAEEVVRLCRSQLDMPLFAAEALHVQALTHRQRGRLEASIKLQDRAREIVETRPFALGGEVVVARLRAKYAESLAESYSRLVERDAGPRARFLRGADRDGRWGRATRLFHDAIRLTDAFADDADFRSRFAHHRMRLAMHRLREAVPGPAAEKDIAIALELAPRLQPASRIIWDRTLATVDLYRGRHDDAMRALRPVADEIAARRYEHQWLQLAGALHKVGVPIGTVRRRVEEAIR